MVNYSPPAVIRVRPLNGRRVLLEYADGTAADVDLTPLLRGPIHAQVRDDESVLQQVRVLPGFGTIEWPDGSDLAPERLYELASEHLRVLA